MLITTSYTTRWHILLNDYESSSKLCHVDVSHTNKMNLSTIDLQGPLTDTN